MRAEKVLLEDPGSRESNRVVDYENMDGALIDTAVAAGAKGVVIAGVGNGNMA